MKFQNVWYNLYVKNVKDVYMIIVVSKERCVKLQNAFNLSNYTVTYYKLSLSRKVFLLHLTDFNLIHNINLKNVNATL